MASYDHKDEITDPSSHINYTYLSTPVKNDRLSRLHEENRKLTLRVTQLEQKLLAVTAQDGITLTDELHNDVKKMAVACTTQIHSTHHDGSFPRLFWDQQVKATDARTLHQ